MLGDPSMTGSAEFWRWVALILVFLVFVLVGWMLHRRRAHHRILISLNRQVLVASEMGRMRRARSRSVVSGQSSTAEITSAANSDHSGANGESDSDHPTSLGISDHSSASTQKEKISANQAGIDPDVARRMRVLYKKIIHVLEDESLALSPDVSLASLARRVSSNEKYVSKAISECGDTSFYALINEYRIQKALEILSDSSKDAPSGDILAGECGFGSRSSFYEVFKRHTGLTPRAFRKEVLRP